MQIIEAVDGLYTLIALTPFRKTPGVTFDMFPMEAVAHIDAVDRVIHDHGAISPGGIGSVDRPWYMHPYQDDNLLVLQGRREVDIYTAKHGKIEHFTVYPDKILKNDVLVYEGSAVLVWPKGVFHRIQSGDQGSISINLAVHHKGFDIKTNFNIYDLDPERGTFALLREGYKDQE